MFRDGLDPRECYIEDIQLFKDFLLKLTFFQMDIALLVLRDHFKSTWLKSVTDKLSFCRSLVGEPMPIIPKVVLNN